VRFMDAAYVTSTALLLLFLVIQLSLGLQLVAVRRDLHQKKRILSWMCILMASSLICYQLVRLATSGWESLVVLAITSYLFLMNACMYLSLTLSNTLHAVANLSLEAPIWLPRVVYGGMTVFTLSYLVCLSSLLASGKRLWRDVYAIFIGLAALCTGACISISTHRLRHHLIRSIAQRSANSVYINVTNGSSASPASITDDNKSNRDIPMQAPSVTTTSSTTPSEAQLLKNLLLWRNLSAVCGILGMGINFYNAISGLSSPEVREKHFREHYEEVNGRYDRSYDTGAWVGSFVNACLIYVSRC